uniref:Down syndrome cell adhesion molecule-like protein Dscam2 n=1 Tax=Rhabditophanes sp. KR3021 TaxID=114890 RepID=A0AC35UCA7_9BILA
MDGVLLREDEYTFENERQRLVIDSVESGDAGHYNCLVANTVSESEKDIVLSILKAPEVLTAQQSVQVKEGNSSVFDCPILENNGVITWSRNGIPVNSISSNIQVTNGGKSLNILKVAKSHEGTFNCYIENGAGNGTANFELNVLIPPTITGPSFKSIDSAVGSNVTLSCVTSGSPTPVITWLLDSKPIPEGDTFELNGGELKIVGVQFDHKGRYSCESSNKVGTASKDFLVQVTELPQIKPMTSVLKVIEGQGATIRCEMSGNTVGNKVEWRKNGEKFASNFTHSSSNLHYIYINQAKLSDASNYTCLISNLAGEVSDTTQLKVIVPPTIIEGEKFIKIKEGEDLLLDCTSFGHPKPAITWRQGGIILNHTEEKLLIPTFTRDKATRFSCEAKNEANFAAADFVVEVLVKPTLKDTTRDIRVRENSQARLECKADGIPHPTITWLRGGRPITDKSNVLLSPRGESLMILKARKSDAGNYQCVAKSSAGETEGVFSLSVLTAPTIEQSIDQNPRVIFNNDAVLHCPVISSPPPTVTWERDGVKIDFEVEKRYKLVNGTDLLVTKSKSSDGGKFTCIGVNDVSELATDFILEVIDKPKFGTIGQTNYDVVIENDIVMTCPVDISSTRSGQRQQNSLLNVVWLKNGEVLVADKNKIHISQDGLKLTVMKSTSDDGGRFVCRLSNQAGEAEIDLSLKVLVPPKIDKSNLIQNPLAILERTTVLECPNSGIPTPTTSWLRDGVPISGLAEKYKIHETGQSIEIKNIEIQDQARYTCVVENRGGRTSEDFNLEVLIPPQMERDYVEKVVKREGEVLSLVCPLKINSDPNANMHVSWYKNKRPLDPMSSLGNFKITSEGRRFQIASVSLYDASNYSCTATNRAGESSSYFEVNILCTVFTTKYCRDLERLDILDNVYDFKSQKEPSKKRLLRRLKFTRDDEIRLKAREEILMEAIYPEPTPEAIIKIMRRPNKWHKISRQGNEQIEESVHESKQAYYDDNHNWNNLRYFLAKPTMDSTKIDLDPHVYEDQNVLLWCPSSGNPEPTVTWYKNSIEVESLNDPRITVFTHNNSLSIANAGAGDKAMWSCQATNDAGSNDLEILLDVWIKPQVTLSSETGTVKKVGSPVSIYCNASGNPEPVISWKFNENFITTSHDGVRLSQQNARLDIPKLKESDVGGYYCVATNDYATAEGAITVDILIPPSIDRDGIDATPRLPTGKTLILSCEENVGKPQSKLEWTINGTSVREGNPLIQISDEGRLLKIPNLTLGDKGLYQCTAVNEAGTNEFVYKVDVDQVPVIFNSGIVQGVDQQAFNLEILIKPSISESSPNATVIPVNTPFSLFCTPRGYPPPQVIFFLDEEPIELALAKGSYNTTSEDGDLNIGGISKPGTYVIRCEASNPAGIDDKELVVKILLPPSLATNGKKGLNITEGEPAALTCDISQADPENIEWKKDGVVLKIEEGYTLSEDKTVLQIMKTKLKDEGKFSCEGRNKAGNVTQEIEVFIGVPPKISEKSTLIKVKQGEKGEIWCEGAGIPSPKITWMKDNEPLLNTAFDSIGGEIRAAAIFEKVTSEMQGVYACKVENWAGTVYKDFDLVVLIPPTITPKEQEITATVGDVVIMECNSTGNPEPLLTWVKLPDVNISGSEGKYKLMGQTLAINNVTFDDEGYYNCIAKSDDAGQAIAKRKLTVKPKEQKFKVIYVTCDDFGNPISTELIENRGDSPESDLLVFSNKPAELAPNGTDRIYHKCSPKLRDPRKLPYLLGFPEFIVKPLDKIVSEGETITLNCSAAGPPLPILEWLRNGVPMKEFSKREGNSSITVAITKSNQSTIFFTCVAKNSIGTSRVAAKVTVIDKAMKSTTKVTNVTLVDCLLPPVFKREVSNKAGPGKVIFKIDNQQINPNDESIHIMNNNSMVIGYPAPQEDLNYIDCYIDGHQGTPNASYIEVKKDVAPKVVIRQVRIFAKPNTDVLIDCRLKKGNPLTTKVRWSKDDVDINLLGDKYHVFGNNSLLIKNVNHRSRGNSATISGIGSTFLPHGQRYSCFFQFREKFGFGVGLPSKIKIVFLLKAIQFLSFAHNYKGTNGYVNKGSEKYKYFLIQNTKLLTYSEMFYISNFHAFFNFQNFKCRASTSKGKSFDSVKLFIDDKPASVEGVIGGFINDQQIKSQNLMMGTDSTFESNDFVMKIENLVANTTSLTKSLVNILSIPFPLYGYQSEGGNIARKKGLFDRMTEYNFDTGHKLRVKQKGKGYDDNKLNMDVEFDGNMPDSTFENINFDDFEEILVESNPGQLTGKGKSAYNLNNNKHRVNFRWNDQIDYEREPTDSNEILNGEHVKITGSPQINNDMMKMATKATKLDNCPDGFLKIKNKCVDIDECKLDVCNDSPDSECVNLPGSYECTADACPVGYNLHWDGTCTDVNECSRGHQVCEGNKECRNLDGSFECVDVCASGFKLNKFNVCEDVDECKEKYCDFTMNCNNFIGEYMCWCPVGFPDVNGTCRGLAFDEEHPVKDIDYSKDEYHEKCPSNYHWNGTTCGYYDSCSFDAPCYQHSCHNTATSYYCTCLEGYSKDASGQSDKCLDIDECAGADVCAAGKLCLNVLGSFSCVSNPCPQGFHFEDRMCKPNCYLCNLSPIRIETIAVKRGISKNTPFLRLTTTDTHDRVLTNTEYHLNYDYRFRIENSNGRGTILNTESLDEASVHKLMIHSTPKDTEGNILRGKIQKTILYVSVSPNDF